jgi:hypothetical protein
VEYRAAVSEAHERVERVTAALREQVAEWHLQPVVAALMTLRGIELIAAVTLSAELGDLRRFAHPKQLMAFLGLIHRRHTASRVAFPVESDFPEAKVISSRRDIARIPLAPVDTRGPYQKGLTTASATMAIRKSEGTSLKRRYQRAVRALRFCAKSRSSL